MLKKLIILLSVFAIENSINCAEAQNVIGIKYITEITPADLVQIVHADVCGICLQELLSDTSNLYKSNCPQVLTDNPHLFHRGCILGWISSDQSSALNCPVCRGQMVDLNVTLIEAIENGNLEAVRLLLDRGADINARDNHGYTLLIIASLNIHLKIVQLLLDRGAHINSRDSFENIALMYASQNGHLEMVRLLLDRGADINAKSDFGSTALIKASADGHLEIVQLLLDKGADVNTRVNSGYTALMIAHRKGYQEIADLLIARGAIE